MSKTLSIMMGGSTELSAPNIHAVTRERSAGSSGISAGLRSAMWCTMAPDSKSLRPSHSIAGTWPKGCSAR